MGDNVIVLLLLPSYLCGKSVVCCMHFADPGRQERTCDGTRAASAEPHGIPKSISMCFLPSCACVFFAFPSSTDRSFKMTPRITQHRRLGCAVPMRGTLTAHAGGGDHFNKPVRVGRTGVPNGELYLGSVYSNGGRAASSHTVLNLLTGFTQKLYVLNFAW